MNYRSVYKGILSPDNLLIGLVFGAAAILNLQFMDGSNVNFLLSGHDEYIAVREVYSILNPISYKHFLMSVISGDILYYGRIMFYVDALISYLPFKLFGLHGLVYSIRMIHVLFLLSGIILLGRTFIKDWKFRLLFYLGTTTIYYSFYFFMVPKPDPMQLFTLAVFLYYFNRNEYAFGKYFFLLGIAYGLKFNIITLLPWMFVIPFLTKGSILKDTIRELFFSMLHFIAGILAAIPCLVLSPLKPIFLKSYYNSTFGYVDQYDDELSHDGWEWIEKGWFGAYNGGILFGVALMILMFIILYSGLKKYIQNGKLDTGLIILVSGLFIFIPVLILTKRIWPHYLWTGYLLIFLGLIMFVQKRQTLRYVRIISLTFLLTIIIGSLSCTYAQGKHLFSLQSNSDQLLKNGNQAYHYLRTKSSSFIAIQEISVPYPFIEMLKIAPYHPFATVLEDTVKQKFIWQGFISPEIVERNKAGYILTNKINFNDTMVDLRTMKDSTVLRNNYLMRKELGKTIFFDTTFGSIKIYKVPGNLE